MGFSGHLITMMADQQKLSLWQEAQSQVTIEKTSIEAWKKLKKNQPNYVNSSCNRHCLELQQPDNVIDLLSYLYINWVPLPV